MDHLINKTVNRQISRVSRLVTRVARLVTRVTRDESQSTSLQQEKKTWMMDIRKWLRKGKNASDENEENDERHVVGGGGGGKDDHVDEIPTEAGQPGQASNVSPAAVAPAQAAEFPRSAAASGSGVTVKPLPDDLGSERSNQVVLQQYPGHLFQNKSRSFVSSWYQTNELLEYSVQTDGAFCYPCRKFNTARGPVDSTFTVRGYQNWKHAVEKDRGFHKHATSKEHVTCVLRWKENERRIDCGEEISTLFNADQLNRDRYYVSALIDVVGFLAENQIPFRGSLDNFEDMSDGHSGLFLSLLNYTLKKGTELAEIIKHIPRNASYTS
uniref:TTF-type domain-containing protein n=1 Tax=Eptatretus burgeri TaxID=7764 RepID=A0A8C4N1Y2_EPTBU